jgi:hypothetical protein
MRRNFISNIGVPLLALMLLTLNTIRVYPNEFQDKGRTPYPFIETFEGGVFPPTEWALYSQLNDSQNWELDPWTNHTEGGSNSAFHNQSPEFAVDNWLVTPQISMPTEGFYYLTFWSWLANNWSYKKSSVLVSTGSPDPADNDYVEVWMLTETNNAWAWYQQFVNLEAYAGQNIYVAFRYEGDPMGHTWYVDDIALGEEVDDSPVLNVSTLEVYQAVGLNGTGSKTFNVINNGILDLNFDIEIEYLNAEGWLSINPTSGSLGTHQSVEILLDFDAAGLGFGTYQANLNISSNDPVNPTATVLVTLEVVDANVYPFTEDFESETFPPIGWSMFDSDEDGNLWALSYYNNTPGGQYSAYHGWGNQYQDGWLVSPQISVPEEGFFYLSFWSLVGDASYYYKNSVLVSNGSGNPADEDFTEVWTIENVEETWVQHFINLEAFAGQDVYFAFRYEGELAHYWVVDDISLGAELDDSPVMNVSTFEINQTVGLNGSGSKSFEVMNDGIQNLTFDIEIEFLDADSWLTASPTSGSIPAMSDQTISLTFDASGLALGIYQANIHISSNDLANPTDTIVATLNVMEAQPVVLTTIFEQYTFPTGVSSNGLYVSGSQFGGMNSYLWTMFSGSVGFPGDAQKVSDNGIAAGTYYTEFQYEGMDVSTAGLWNKTTGQWQFLGMNPDSPEIFGTSYNLAYGITADGITVVGAQWYPDWTIKAFSWTQEEGYDMIGSVIQGNTRANGISANGSVIYGWAEPIGSRTPVIWYNDEIIFIDETQFGEAFGSSASGNYVTGSLGWAGGFIWSPTEGTTIFQNSLNLGTLNPLKVLDDGTVFGYTGEGFPPMPPDRRAFVRHPDGSMETFNEYVSGRGWFEASDWIFFSVNDVTPDGNKFIGAAQLPSGESISFILDLNPGNSGIEINPMVLAEELAPGNSSIQTLAIENVGNALLYYDIIVQYTATTPKVRQVPTGVEYNSGKLALVNHKVSNQDNDEKTVNQRGTVLHYDGPNANSIGLIDGGTYYGAARFPSELTSVFENYQFESVDVYINNNPSNLKLIIWDAGTTTSPGSILYQQNYIPIPESWNTVVLDNAITISGSDIWIGFEVIHEAGTYILGFDGGPAVQDGDWVSEDGTNWEHLTSYGMNGNWNIRANLSFNGMNWLSVNPETGVVDGASIQDIAISFNSEGLEVATYTANLRIISNDSDNPLLIIPVTLMVDPNASVIEMDQFDVSLFPNPAGNHIQVQANQLIERISITDISGKTICTDHDNSHQVLLDISFLRNGMYLIQIITKTGTSTKKLQVIK